MNPPCYMNSTWTEIFDVSCVSPWPSSNANDTAFAVGTSQFCRYCSGYGAPGVNYSVAWEEYQIANRAKQWARYYWNYRFVIAPTGAGGQLRVTLDITYGLYAAFSTVAAGRNRVKIANIDCLPTPESGSTWTGTVTSIDGWIYAPAIDSLIEPRRCVDEASPGCPSEKDAEFLGSCDEYQESVGTQRRFLANGTCVDGDVLIYRVEGEKFCNLAPGTSEGVTEFCYFFPLATNGIVNVSGASSSGDLQVAAYKQWTALVDCDDLYSGPITLNLIGPTFPGEIFEIATGPGTPFVQQVYLGLPCVFPTGPYAYQFSIPNTIQVTIAP